MMVNPAGVRHQIHGNVVQSTSRVLKEEVSFTETTAVANREWGGYPILTFPELPAPVNPRPPSAAAIVNAVYHATGVRFRELPLTPERVLAGLGKRSESPASKKRRRRFALCVLANPVFRLHMDLHCVLSDRTELETRPRDHRRGGARVLLRSQRDVPHPGAVATLLQRHSRFFGRHRPRRSGTRQTLKGAAIAH